MLSSRSYEWQETSLSPAAPTPVALLLVSIQTLARARIEVFRILLSAARAFSKNFRSPLRSARQVEYALTSFGCREAESFS